MPDKIYAVIDTNVLVSALFSLNGDSNPAQVIRRDKFPFKLSDIEYVMKVFTKYGVSVEETISADESIVTGNIRHV